MRPSLLAAAVAAAILVPVALWYRPAAAPADAEPSAADDRPDRVEVAKVGDQLPFGCPGTQFCNCYSTARLAVLVQHDAVWLGSNHGYFAPPVRFQRDQGGAEWAALREVLLPVPIAELHHHTLEIAIDDRAAYSDLLLAMASAREAGFQTFQLVQPALPVYPNHGWEGGMGF